MLRSMVRVVMPLLLLFVCNGCGESDSAQNETSLDLATLAAPGPYAAAILDLDLVDTSRATPPNGTYAGSPERHLPARVWYPTMSSTATTSDPPPPASDGPFPLIGYGHGFFSSRFEGEIIGSHLASHGYIMIAVDFPLSNGSAPGGASVGDMTNQPGDLAFAMAQVENGTAGEELAAAVDPTRRGIAGLSLGGGTVLIAAYHPKWRIENIQAAVAYAPASCFFGTGLFQNSLPMLMLSGDHDLLVSLPEGPARAFANAPPPISLITLHGGNHVGFIGLEKLDGGNADDVGCIVVGMGGANASRDFATLFERLMEGIGPDAVDTTSCADTCTTHVPQTMPTDRQREITRAATLAHFEAILRGNHAAQRWLDQSLGAENSDVTVETKR